MKRLRSVDPICYENLQTINSNPRKIKAETKIRSQFISTGFRKFPKKEYIRCKLIRGHKRILREIMENEEYIKHVMETNDSQSCKQVYWSLLVNSFIKYKKILVELIPVVVGPVNEIMKKKKMKIDHLKRSFNAEFCKEYMKRTETRESYHYYVEFIFSDMNCAKLIKKFGFKCCNNEDHNYSCIMKWLLLKKFCGQMILEELDIVPYSSTNLFCPLPSIWDNV